MQQESCAVRCGNFSPQEDKVCGDCFRLFKLIGLIWPLSMDRLLSPSTSSNPLFFRSLAKMRAGIRGLDLCRDRRRLLSATPPSSLPCRLPKLFPGLLNVCMREIGNADKRPCKFNPSVCPPFDSLADKEGSPYLLPPATPLHSCQPLSYPAAYVSSTDSRGRRESLVEKGQCAIF